MNRVWIGIGLLVILLAMGIGLLWGSTVFFEEFSAQIEQAGELAMAGNWAEAEKKAEFCRSQWKRWRYFWSSFTDHEPIEQMQNLFSQLEVYGGRQLDVDFATMCHNIYNVAEAIRESHGLKWWSIL